MCLFPFMGGMQPQCPPSQKGLQYKSKLYILLAVHLVLSLFYMFFHFMGGLMELISVLILYCATAQMNYCQLIIYMVIQGNKLITSLATIGLYIQRGTFLKVFEYSYLASYVIIMMVFIIFYIFAIILCFYAYREFKGMMFDNGMGQAGGLGNLLGQNMMGMGGGSGQQNINNQNSNYQRDRGGSRPNPSNDNSIPLINRNAQNNNSNMYAAGSSNANYTQDNEANRQRSASPNNRQGGFVPFSGQGVRLGGGTSN